MFLNEEYLDAGQTERKMASYVKFYQPFVVAVVEYRMEDHIHQELFREFTGKYKFQLAGYSENAI
jgi:hypothetical protein